MINTCVHLESQRQTVHYYMGRTGYNSTDIQMNHTF